MRRATLTLIAASALAGLAACGEGAPQGGEPASAAPAAAATPAVYTCATKAFDAQDLTAPPTAGDGVVDWGPAWKDQPRPGAPDAMIDAGVDKATVNLSCDVADTGSVVACKVLGVEPKAPDMGLALAAVEAACAGKFLPRTFDSKPVAGRSSFPVAFKAPVVAGG